MAADDIRFIIDFDSTLVRAETLELAVDLVPDGGKVRKRIREITDAAMGGRALFQDALRERIKLLHMHRDHLQQLGALLREEVTPSFKRNRAFLAANAANIYVVSSGFREVILPVVKSLGLKPENTFANTLRFDAEGFIEGVDWNNPLSADGGKLKLVRGLQLDGEVVVIGDGWSDYEVFVGGGARRFYAFTENVRRPEVTEARGVRQAPNFDEVLFDCGLKGAVSYPKNRLKVLLLENIHPEAVAAFEREGYAVESLKGSPPPQELAARLQEVSILGIRSKTQVDETVLAEARRLLAVGAFCIGTNQIDLPACERRGVVVFNAPFSNTRSVVELALAELIMLLRGIPAKMRMMDRGTWDKSAEGAHEVRGKKLGIVGYGNIGMQLSVLAESLGMQVCFYDVAEKLALGTAQRCASLDELLRASDAVTVHVDGRKENGGLIGAREFTLMKEGAVFLNLSRGHVVDLDALRSHLRSGHLAGAAVDVFPEEPHANGERFEHPLRDVPEAILTPHVGGSTLEAQQDIGRFVSHRIVDYINTGSTENSVNFPAIRLPPQAQAHRLIHLHENVPGILARINQALAAHGANISGQYLKTNERVGYVITDINHDYSDALLDEIRRIPHTLRFRVLY